MPEIDFYFSKKDFAELGEMIFTNGMLAVLGCNSPTRQYKTVKSLDGFLEAAKVCRQFFLLHDSYNNSPLCVRQTVGNDGVKFYYIMPRDGGTHIDLLWYGDDKKGIRSGSLSHYPTYWDTVEEANLPAPESLKQECRKLAKFVKKGSKKLVWPVSKRSIYLGGEAKYLRNSGVPLIGWDDVPPRPS